MQDVEDKSENDSNTAGGNGEGWRVETLSQGRRRRPGNEPTEQETRLVTIAFVSLSGRFHFVSVGLKGRCIPDQTRSQVEQESKNKGNKGYAK